MARITGDRIDAGIVKGNVSDACLLRILRSAYERDLRDVVTVKVRLRVRLRHLDQCDSGAASNVRDLRPGLELADDAVELGQRARDELRSEPWGQQSLDAPINFRAELIVGQSPTALEGFGKEIEHRHLLWQRAESAGEEERTVLVRQNQRGLGTQLKTAFAFVVDQVGRCLTIEPFANPPLMQPVLCASASLVTAPAPLNA
jgi:hypothetical protein